MTKKSVSDKLTDESFVPADVKEFLQFKAEVIDVLNAQREYIQAQGDYIDSTLDSLRETVKALTKALSAQSAVNVEHENRFNKLGELLVVISEGLANGSKASSGRDDSLMLLPKPKDGSEKPN